MYGRTDPRFTSPDTSTLSESDVVVGACRLAIWPPRMARHSLSMTRRHSVHAVAKLRASLTTASLLHRSHSYVGDGSPRLREGLCIDVRPRELDIVLRSGVPASRVILHGNNKSHDELERALAAGVHRVIVDNFDEIDRLRALVGPTSPSTASCA